MAGLSQRPEVVTMCEGPEDGLRFPDLQRDPLIRLVMESDGVTEQETNAVMDQLRRLGSARVSPRSGAS